MRCLVLVLGLGLAGGLFGDDTKNITRMEAPGGEVVFLNDHERKVMHERFTYAATRRAGDFVFVSGLEIGPEDGEGSDVESFKRQVHRGLSTIQTRLAAADASFQDVVQIQSFHNCETDAFEGDLNEQIAVIVEVKKAFMKPPYSTWTALCVAGHFTPTTVVEIQVTAYAPK